MVEPGGPASILILTACDLEARALARSLELSVQFRRPFRAFGRGALRIAPVGVGAAVLKDRWPLLVEGLDRPLVVSAGLCGGLDPALATGDLVIPREVLGPAGARFDLGPSPRGPARAQGSAASPRGALVSTLELAATPAEKAALRARTGAAAVDMESAAIVSAAVSAGAPWLVVRAVSDAAGDAVPRELAGLLEPDGRLRLAGAVRLALHPRAMTHAVALGRASRRALAAVGRVLRGLAA